MPHSHVFAVNFKPDLFSGARRVGWPGLCGGEAGLAHHYLLSSSPTMLQKPSGALLWSMIHGYLSFLTSTRHYKYEECDAISSPESDPLKLIQCRVLSPGKSEISVTVTGDCDVKCHTCDTLVTRCVTGRDNGDTYLLLLTFHLSSPEL